MTTGNAGLELRRVTKQFGGGYFNKDVTVAVDDISLSISSDQPGITAIAGESGSGKTTIARLLMGIVAPTSGDVLYNGKNVEKMSRSERSEYRREIQPIFQDPFEVYNPFYKIDHIFTTPVSKFKLAGSKAEGRKLIEGALESVGLRPDETLGRFPHQLSGGQRQRAMVARALMLKPRIILADEPVSMVDASIRATILDSIRQLNRELGIAVVYITHDLTTAYQVAENIIILYRGSVAEAGNVEQVIKDPKHPYTQLLVESIPQPDPKRRWDEYNIGSVAEARQTQGCKFADRCPAVMDECWTTIPELYRSDESRAASCFLYREAPVLAGRDLAATFTSSPQTAGNGQGP